MFIIAEKPADVQPENPPDNRTTSRLNSVDLLRGLVMIIMCLDHTRDYFSTLGNPTNLATTTPALFFTRWITHYCAPVFVFLAGTGAYLSLIRGKTRSELARFLWTRGLWLVFLELTVIRFLWFFNVNYQFNMGQVIWAIGWSMVCLAALIYLPLPGIAAFGLILMFGHNSLDGIKAESWGSFSWLWSILHSGDIIRLDANHMFIPMYPLIPWIGVMALGYVCGAAYRLEPDARRKILLRVGLAAIAVFVALRATNLYGDPEPWSAQRSGLFTVMAFLKCEKYPPSLLYLLITLGPALVFLALAERPLGRLGRAIVTFGRVPLFYYMAHLFLLHAAQMVYAYAKYGPAGMQLGPMKTPRDFGFDLIGVYIIWLSAVVLLYPLCSWFASVKERKKSVWLSYL